MSHPYGRRSIPGQNSLAPKTDCSNSCDYYITFTRLAHSPLRTFHNELFAIFVKAQLRVLRKHFSTFATFSGDIQNSRIWHCRRVGDDVLPPLPYRRRLADWRGNSRPSVQPVTAPVGETPTVRFHSVAIPNFATLPISFRAGIIASKYPRPETTGESSPS